MNAYHPTKQIFQDLIKSGKAVEMWKEISAVGETPVSAYLKLGLEPYSCLLESIEGEEKFARYSFLAIKPFMVFQSKGNNVTLTKFSGIKQRKPSKKTFRSQDPLETLKSCIAKIQLISEDSSLPRLSGGAIGCIAYEYVKKIESIGNIQKEGIDLPELIFVFPKVVLAFDHLKNKIKIIRLVLPDEKTSYMAACRDIENTINALKQPIMITTKRSSMSPVKSNTTKKEFEKSVIKAKRYIKDGDIIQAVLSQRLHAEYDGDTFEIYRALRILNPSPYMYYFNFGDLKIIGASPEILVRLENGTAVLRPIAGTRPRGRDLSEDKKLQSDLLNDEKELAEHLMLVDLGRNDLGKVCNFGSVKLKKFMIVERYSHVMHIVSEVSGVLNKNISSFDLFKATFPAGTVSGAPKIRAMQIIEELEPTRRGLYAGAVGYFDYRGNMDFAINIRTIIVKGKHAYIQAGAGIVADSVPEKEYEETLNKSRAMLKAIEMAANKVVSGW
ncbi:MAG: Anthranilate synthase component 1 [Elusimicrobia bacterium ADurb.Bin231]|nr:MAG: Anthranilate synthase component 1 [Elusimicrobia bacterium ADurb.Bin231]